MLNCCYEVIKYCKKKKTTIKMLLLQVYQAYIFYQVTMNEKTLIIMKSFCNRYMRDEYKNMFYECYYFDMIWNNQKSIISFCR